MKRLVAIVIGLIMIFSNLAMCFAVDAKPLFEFDYDGSHIQTFGTYSIVDGVICYSHRYFIKDNNLVVIDQNLQPTPTGIFIHFEGGKSYIAVLCKSGRIVSLGTEDLCSTLKDFKNSEIKSLAETISYDSRYLNFEYNDGSKRTYDCVTGELYSQSGATSPKSAEEFFNEYFAGVIDKSTSMGVDTSGAKAQGVVNALNETDSTLEELLDAGIVEGIEADYASEADTGEFSGDWSYEVRVGSQDESPTEYDPYDFTENDDYQKLMESKEAELSESDVVALRDLFAKISRGELSAKEAVNLIPMETNSTKDENKDLEKTGTSEQRGDKDKTAGEEVVEKKESKDVKISTSNIDEVTKQVIISAIDSVEESTKAHREDHKSEKKFIESKPKNKYVAVYNATEKRYEIYSEKNLLGDPENLETEEKKVTDIIKVNNLNKLLSSEKNNDIRRGMNLFITIALAIITIAAIIVIIGVLNSKKIKNNVINEQ